jgi:UDP-N-acetylmuramate dehydrogenase
MFETSILLSQYSNYKIGGPAKHFFHARGLDELIRAVIKAREMRLPVFILGGGTNLLIGDNGFDGLVLKPNIGFIQKEENTIRAGAGIMMSDLLNFAAEKGLSGLEWAGGLPGTVGGALRGNAGAFGGEIKDSITEILSLDITKERPTIVNRQKSECLFGYRDSIFKRSNSEIILEGVFKLETADPKLVRNAIDEKISYRLQRHPMDYPNIGSIFKNVPWQNVPVKYQTLFESRLKNDPFPILPTAVLIDYCGLKDASHGGAMVSSKHPNFIINHSQATAGDVRSLINLVKENIKNKFDILLEEEVQYV